jgi:hypothetical protein
MRTVWVDFEGAKTSRVVMRQMSKQLSKTRFFSHTEGKRLYFKIESDQIAEAFLISCAKMLREEGFIIELIKK